ncbi:MAG: D-lyxose/D-mannose family sugar isomerase [Hyphomicrobiales bacterium]|nr:MAG: D-lyxose/D-mannose family sugar isomerase [Hyphomicrobiales bacterium]
MKRSEVNKALSDARELLNKFNWALPEWAYWTAEDYVKNPKMAAHLQLHQMGWDVTDFGAGYFSERGLTLFCARNGVQSIETTVPYAEKLLFVEEEQETPLHCHYKKMEDIINRGGGNLILEFCTGNPEDTNEIQVSVDGDIKSLAPHAELRLTPGQSVTMQRGIYHRFYGEAGTGTVLAGEVSQVNDDGDDNYFLDPVARFSNIEEDESPLYPLWNELKGHAL